MHFARAADGAGAGELKGPVPGRRIQRPQRSAGAPRGKPPPARSPRPNIAAKSGLINFRRRMNYPPPPRGAFCRSPDLSREGRRLGAHPRPAQCAAASNAFRQEGGARRSGGRRSNYAGTDFSSRYSAGLRRIGEVGWELCSKGIF